MKCQILFSGKNKKKITKCSLLKTLPRVLSVKEIVCMISQPLFYRKHFLGYNMQEPLSTVSRKNKIFTVL